MAMTLMLRSSLKQQRPTNKFEWFLLLSLALPMSFNMITYLVLLQDNEKCTCGRAFWTRGGPTRTSCSSQVRWCNMCHIDTKHLCQTCISSTQHPSGPPPFIHGCTSSRPNTPIWPHIDEAIAQKEISVKARRPVSYIAS